MRTILLTFFLLTGMISSAQDLSILQTIEPAEEYDNIHVQKIAEDSLQTSYVIWIKKAVKLHYHAAHTENLVVIEGKADMTLGDSTFTIKKGDYINVPMGTHHSVTKVYGKKPLKVLSIQSPKFDGDRIFVTEEKHADY